MHSLLQFNPYKINLKRSDSIRKLGVHHFKCNLLNSFTVSWKVIQRQIVADHIQWPQNVRMGPIFKSKYIQSKFSNACRWLEFQEPINPRIQKLFWLKYHRCCPFCPLLVKSIDILNISGGPALLDPCPVGIN